MFALFQSLFANDTDRDTLYPESLIDAAIERAIDGTDARLRAVSGYRKRLRAPVIHAVDHVVKLVDSLAPPLAATLENYREDALLGMLFASPQRMLEVLAKDRELVQTLARGAGIAQPLYALMMARISAKHTLGIDEQDGQVRHDVEQTVVSFDDHRLIDVNTDAAEMYLALKRRAFDHILSQVLDTMNDRRETRSKLSGQQQLLRRKQDMLREAGWGFDHDPGQPTDRAAFEQQLQTLETSLTALGAETETLNTHLDLLAQTLEHAEQQLWLEPASVILDHRHVQRTLLTAGAREIHYQRLCNAKGDHLAARLLQVDPGLLPKVDFFKEHARYL